MLVMLGAACPELWYTLSQLLESIGRETMERPLRTLAEDLIIKRQGSVEKAT